MERVCEQTQELIALDSELSVPHKNHLQSCDKCKLLMAEYQSLKILVTDSADVEVPLGFADAVMSRIESGDAVLQDDWMQRISNFFEGLMAKQQVQYAALGVGGVISVVNLARFVFFVLIPIN